MNWDLTLLKKYNSTSHLRLIKQLKLELNNVSRSSKNKPKNQNQNITSKKIPFSELNLN